MERTPTAPELADLVQAVARRLRHHTLELGGPLPPHQGRALRVICSGEGLRPARLAERLHIAPRSLTDVLDALEEAGLIRRSPDPLDRRAQILTATADGRAMQQRLEEVRDRAAEEVFASLLPDERDRLGGLLRRVAGPRAG